MQFIVYKSAYSTELLYRSLTYMEINEESFLTYECQCKNETCQQYK